MGGYIKVFFVEYTYSSAGYIFKTVVPIKAKYIYKFTWIIFWKMLSY